MAQRGLPAARRLRSGGGKGGPGRKGRWEAAEGSAAAPLGGRAGGRSGSDRERRGNGAGNGSGAARRAEGTGGPLSSGRGGRWRQRPAARAGLLAAAAVSSAAVRKNRESRQLPRCHPSQLCQLRCFLHLFLPFSAGHVPPRSFAHFPRTDPASVTASVTAAAEPSWLGSATASSFQLPQPRPSVSAPCPTCNTRFCSVSVAFLCGGGETRVYLALD